MIEVKIINNSEETFKKAMQQFKKKCNKDGFLRECKDRKYFRKPSEIKNEKNKKRKRDLEIERKKNKRKY